MRHYLETTRGPWYSYLAALPLLALYQALIYLANAGQPRAVVNGADALLQALLGAIGAHGWLGSWLALAAIAGFLTYRADTAGRRPPLRTGYFGAMLLESAAYALLFGTVVAFLTSLLLPRLPVLMQAASLSLGQKVAGCLGAGLYEELVFRVGMTGGLIWLLRAARWAPGAAAAGAVLLSSLIFSLFHYLGPLGDPFEVGSFTFRFVAGVVLAVLFAVRGFGVAAWTHALYDLFLTLAGRA